MQGGFYCKTCGDYHNEYQTEFNLDVPDPLLQIPKWQRGLRSKREENGMVIDRKTYFLRCRLEVSVDNSADPLAFNIWVRVGELNYRSALLLSNNRNNMNEPPFPGWIANHLSPYPATLNLKGMVHLDPGIGLPQFVLDDGKHPLVQHQRIGASSKDSQTIVEKMLHQV